MQQPAQPPQPPQPARTAPYGRVGPDGPPITVTPSATPTATPAEIYEGLRAQRRELARQLEWLEQQRHTVASQLDASNLNNADKAGLEKRLAILDQRMVTIDQQMAVTEVELSRASAVPGAVVESSGPFRGGAPPDGAFFLGGLFMLVVLLPLSIAWSRRILRRGAAVISGIPKELAAQLTRMEQSMEAMAVEIERIGEAQRFVSRILADGAAQRALGVGAAEPIEVKQREAVSTKK